MNIKLTPQHGLCVLFPTLTALRLGSRKINITSGQASKLMPLVRSEPLPQTTRGPPYILMFDVHSYTSALMY
jgi:hypothetical protein